MSKAKIVKKDKNSRTKSKRPVADHSNKFVEGMRLPPKVVMQIADEVAKMVTQRMGRHEERKKEEGGEVHIENPVFLDTSALIDGRVFDLIRMGAFYGTFAIPEGVLSELKNIADSKDETKKERGRTAMRALEELKKQKVATVVVVDDQDTTIPVDDALIKHAKKHKGRIITCDFNLAKKAQISGVTAVDMYEMANILKTTAIPGEEFYIKVIQKGKGERQGVGYLPDGTMIVIEEGEELIGKAVKVQVERVIQTEAGKIFFGKSLGE